MRDEVRVFAETMEEQLKENDYKGGWQNCSNSYLLGRLKDEVEELKIALLDYESGPAIVKEAVDVANFAMMIADLNSSRR